MIVPRGIADRESTSLEKLLKRNVSLGEIRPALARHTCEVFGLAVRTAERAELLENLQSFEQVMPVSA